MKVNFVYSDLNPCGGAEKFSLVTMRAFLKMGFEIDLTSLEFPDRKRLEMAFGYELVSVMNKVKKINILDIFDSENISRNVENGYDLTINTHGDLTLTIIQLAQKKYDNVLPLSLCKTSH